MADKKRRRSRKPRPRKPKVRPERMGVDGSDLSPPDTPSKAIGGVVPLPAVRVDPIESIKG